MITAVEAGRRAGILMAEINPASGLVLTKGPALAATCVGCDQMFKNDEAGKKPRCASGGAGRARGGKRGAKGQRGRESVHSFATGTSPSARFHPLRRKAHPLRRQAWTPCAHKGGSGCERPEGCPCVGVDNAWRSRGTGAPAFTRAITVHCSVMSHLNMEETHARIDERLKV